MHDPVGVGGDSSTDSGEGRVSALVSPGDNANEDVIIVQGAARVTLASIAATNVKETRADHVRSDDLVGELEVALATEVVVHCVDGHVLELAGSWSLPL